ncbi:MAG: 1-phosphofructokinase [Clostridia bacterium]|nr:1-phosphofructokinase [Clostridia bacterium]
MIYTLTTNPAVDMHITTEQLKMDTVTRTKNAALSGNGKGVNVSLVLERFNVATGVLGFFGGFTGEYIIKECEKKVAKTIPTRIDGETRINVFLVDQNGEYNMVNEGPAITEKNQQELLDTIASLSDLDILVISGSMARGASDDYYDRIIKTVIDKKAQFVIDISSKKLKELLKYRPLLIKPNDDEIEDIFGIKITDDKVAKDVLKMLYDMGAQNVLITMGAKGSYFYNGDSFYCCEPYPVKLKSTICAGDSFLAAFIKSRFAEKLSIEESLKFASATGANVAEHDGIGPLDMVDVYKEKIKVKQI